MHKRKDFYHAGGDDGKVVLEIEMFEPLDLTLTARTLSMAGLTAEEATNNILKNTKPNQPPDAKPSLLTRFTNFLKNRKA